MSGLTRVIIQHKDNGKYIGPFHPAIKRLKNRFVTNPDNANHYMDFDSAKRAIEHMCLERKDFRLIKVPAWYWEK